MHVLASSWRHLLAAGVVVSMLSAAVHLATADSEKPTVAKERKADAEKVERERTSEEKERGHRETQMRKLKERAEQLRRELRELRPEQGDLAEKLEREMREIRERLHAIVAPRHPEPEQERLRNRLEEVKKAMARAREAGQHDELGRLERQAQELMQVLRGGPKRPDGQDREEARRLHHLRQAVENLRAGGFHDLAERLQHEVERRIRQAGSKPLHTPHPEHRDHPARPETPHGPPPPELAGAVRELRAEVRRLHHQVEEMREHLKRIVEERRGEIP